MNKLGRDYTKPVIYYPDEVETYAVAGIDYSYKNSKYLLCWSNGEDYAIGNDYSTITIFNRFGDISAKEVFTVGSGTRSDYTIEEANKILLNYNFRVLDIRTEDEINSGEKTFSPEFIKVLKIVLDEYNKLFEVN